MPDIRRSHTLEDILTTLRSHLPELRERYSIRSLAVFGSYARGEQTEASDVDVLVDFERAPDLIRFADLEEDLAGLTGLRVDMVSAGALRGQRGRRILSEAQSV
jgi:predicted nucleotidyltransferase